MPGIIKMVKLACGKHWGLPSKHRAGDQCRKCRIHAREVKLLQHNGVPWIAVLGPVVER